MQYITRIKHFHPALLHGLWVWTRGWMWKFVTVSLGTLQIDWKEVTECAPSKPLQNKSNQVKSVLLLCQYPQRRLGSVAHQTNQCPKAKIQDSVQNNQQTIGCAGIYGGKAKSKRCVFRRLLKDAVEGADQTKRGSLFHWVGPQERKALAPVLVLTLGTEMLISLFDLSEWGGTDGVNIAFKWSGWFSWKVL